MHTKRAIIPAAERKQISSSISRKFPTPIPISSTTPKSLTGTWVKVHCIRMTLKGREKYCNRTETGKNPRTTFKNRAREQCASGRRRNVQTWMLQECLCSAPHESKPHTGSQTMLSKFVDRLFAPGHRQLTITAWSVRQTIERKNSRANKPERFISRSTGSTKSGHGMELLNGLAIWARWGFCWWRTKRHKDFCVESE